MPAPVGAVLRVGILRGIADDNRPSSEVRAQLHVRERRVHGELRHSAWSGGAHEEHDDVRQDTLHTRISGQHDDDAVLHLHGRGGEGLRAGDGELGAAALGPSVVPGDVLARVRI